jgi:hypothetical protein
MRKRLGFIAALMLMGVPIAAAAQLMSGPAPADEYFGTHHQSVLEIRNRLDRLESRPDAEMYAPQVIHEIDDVAASILDWQRHYPNDPWLPHSLGRILRQYHRAGAGSSPRALEALAVMQQSYPNSDETARALAIMGQTRNAGLGDGVWARFDAMRADAGGDGPP